MRPMSLSRVHNLLIDATIVRILRTHTMIEFLEGRKEESSGSAAELPLSYGKFLFSRLGKGQGLTLANTLRRILYYEFSSVGITSVALSGFAVPGSVARGRNQQQSPPNGAHEFSTLPGLKESLFEILLNLQCLVFDNTFPYESPQSAYLVLTPPGLGRGERTADGLASPNLKLSASDIILPSKVHLVFPDQHVTTLVSPVFDDASLSQRGPGGSAEENTKEPLFLDMKIERIFHSDIQNHSSNSPRTRRKEDRLISPIDGSLFPIKKVNYTIEKDTNSLDGVGEVVFFEVWTNGSIEPKEAVYQAVEKSISLFQKFI